MGTSAALPGEVWGATEAGMGCQGVPASCLCGLNHAPRSSSPLRSAQVPHARRPGRSAAEPQSQLAHAFFQRPAVPEASEEGRGLDGWMGR